MQGDDLIVRVAAQGTVELWETASGHSLDGPLGRHFTDAALLERAFGQVTADCALAAHYQQDARARRSPGALQPDLQRTGKGVVVEEGHSSGLGAVRSILKLRQDHRCQLDRKTYADLVDSSGNGPAHASSLQDAIRKLPAVARRASRCTATDVRARQGIWRGR